MKKEPILLILAAGMGSRYGGLKQIDPVGPSGEIIIDYSIFDAMKAGFRRFVFVIKEENREVFDEVLLSHLPKELEIHIAYQDMEAVPAHFSVPVGRKKPWGTSHAIFSAASFLDAPFAVINSDDYYGQEAFSKIYTFLCQEDISPTHHAMVGFRIQNTLTEHGSVSRGVCRVSEGKLQGITERKNVFKDEKGARYEDEEGSHFLSPDTIVSMNFWGFQEEFLDVLEESLENFFANGVQEDPLKAEALLPEAVDGRLQKGELSVDVLTTDDAWMGVTYHDDKEKVMQGFRNLAMNGVYPTPIWQSIQ